MFKDSLDILLEDAIKEHSTEIDIIKSIEVPNVDLIMLKFKHNQEEELSHKSALISKKSYHKFITRAASIVITVLLTSLVSFFIYDVPQVKAVKTNIIKVITDIKDNKLYLKHISKSTNEMTSPIPPPPAIDNNKTQDEKTEEKISIPDIKDKIPFAVLIPDYLPAGYQSKEITWTKYSFGMNIIKQIYSDSGKKSITITQTSGYSGDFISNGTAENVSEVKKINIKGVEATHLYFNETSHYVIWFKDGFKYEINCEIPEEELTKIINSLKGSQ